MTARSRRETGLTLTEVTIVMVLAGMVMTGLVGFYLSSQATWIDGSSQAITQREANLVLESIRQRARPAWTAHVAPNPDATHALLQLDYQGFPPSQSHYYFWWEPSDSLIHEGYGDPRRDQGPVLQSKVETFDVTASNTMVRVNALQLRTAGGQHVRLSTFVQLVNGGP